jgi:hypothetical protein
MLENGGIDKIWKLVLSEPFPWLSQSPKLVPGHPGAEAEAGDGPEQSSAGNHRGRGHWWPSPSPGQWEWEGSEQGL